MHNLIEIFFHRRPSFLRVSLSYDPLRFSPRFLGSVMMNWEIRNYFEDLFWYIYIFDKFSSSRVVVLLMCMMKKGRVFLDTTIELFTYIFLKTYIKFTLLFYFFHSFFSLILLICTPYWYWKNNWLIYFIFIFDFFMYFLFHNWL